MDKLTHLSLFSGIGGLDLAAEWAGFKTVGQCEWADYPTKVLENHWPYTARWRDIRTLKGDSFYEQSGLHTVTVISGGFPCQPFSTAGKRRGKEDNRYLWPEMLRIIKEIGPAYVVGENVAGIVNMALDTVLSDLEALGYATRAFIVPACGVDARHRRNRVAIVGYSEHNGQFAEQELRGDEAASDNRWAKEQKTPGKPKRTNRSADVSSVQGRECGSKQILANADHPGFQVSGYESAIHSLPTKIGAKHSGGFITGGWWPFEPDVGRVAYGVSSRVDRLKCLGNAVVPAQFYPIFKAIAEQWAGAAQPTNHYEL